MGLLGGGGSGRMPDMLGWGCTAGAQRAAVLLPGGAVRSRGRYWRFVDVFLRGVAAQLAERGADDGFAVYLLRYRVRGWNGDSADTAADARWALAQIAERHGPVPVALVGNSLGGRAAFWVAGDPAVTSVVGVAPWLPPGDPVEQLAGRKVLILHGDRDRGEASAVRSLAYAQRARDVVPDLARLELEGDNHYLLRRAADCWAAAAAFVLGTTGTATLPPVITSAMQAPGLDGLRTPLPQGFAVQK